MPNLQYLLKVERLLPQSERQVKSIANLVRDVVTPKTKGLGYFKPHTSKLSVREQLGLSKGAWNDLNKYQKQALEDYAQYKLSGQFRNKFIWSPKEGKYRYGKTVQRGRGETSGAEHIIQDPKATVTETFMRTGDGKISYHPAQEQARVSIVPEKSVFGEMILTPEGNGLQKQIVLTSPKVDAIASGLDDAVFLANLPNRIPKQDMRKFWELVDQTSKPGSYISGDMGSMPLGGFMIKSKSPSKAIQTLIEDVADKGGIVNRPGLSPDSYLAVIKQGQRPGHDLRFSRNGFTKLNNSAVDNAALYNQWKAASTPELKQQFIQDWNSQIYPGTAKINDQGLVEFLQPYFFMRKNGGKLIPKWRCD